MQRGDLGFWGSRKNKGRRPSWAIHPERERGDRESERERGRAMDMLRQVTLTWGEKMNKNKNKKGGKKRLLCGRLVMAVDGVGAVGLFQILQS